MAPAAFCDVLGTRRVASVIGGLTVPPVALPCRVRAAGLDRPCERSDGDGGSGVAGVSQQRSPADTDVALDEGFL